MWKSCFYKQIEDYRKALKIMKQKYESIRPRHPELTKKLAHLTNSFQEFLNTSIQYFQNFKMEVSISLYIYLYLFILCSFFFLFYLF